MCCADLSVSKGHGIKHHDGLYAPENMHVRIFNYLDDKFPGNGNAVFKESAKDNGKNSFVNGAQGGVGSDYFSMCFGEHIPDDVDLVIIELGELTVDVAGEG
jgi:hypothetical protein